MPEQKNNNEQMPIDTTSSHAFAKPNVVRTPNEQPKRLILHENGSTLTDDSVFLYTSRKSGRRMIIDWPQILDLIHKEDEVIPDFKNLILD